MPRDKVRDWLLEPDQPSVRYLALTQLLGKSETDSDVRDAKARIPSAGGPRRSSPAATRAAGGSATRTPCRRSTSR